jgi:hypothetical protein
MKKLMLGLALFTSLVANAQKSEENEKLNNVKINVISILASTAAVSYERQLNASSSAVFQLNYTGASISDTKIRGIIATPEYRYYPKKEGFKGFFVGPYLRYQNLKFESEISGTLEKASLNSFGGGVNLGKKWLTGNFSLELFGGPSFNAGSIKYVGSASEDDFNFRGGLNGFGVRFGFSAGFVF